MRHTTVQEWFAPEKLQLLQGWAREGATDAQIAERIGISPKTLYNWRKVPEKDMFGNVKLDVGGNPICPILQALKRGKEVVDFAVENALLKAAIAGNVTAQIFWLKNRKPKIWKNEFRVDVDDKDGTEDKTPSAFITALTKELTEGMDGTGENT